MTSTVLSFWLTLDIETDIVGASKFAELPACHGNMDNILSLLSDP